MCTQLLLVQVEWNTRNVGQLVLPLVRIISIHQYVMISVWMAASAHLAKCYSTVPVPHVLQWKSAHVCT